MDRRHTRCARCSRCSSLIIAAFVIIAHAVLAAFFVVRRHRQAEPVAPVIRSLGAAFGITAAVALLIYGPTAESSAAASLARPTSAKVRASVPSHSSSCARRCAGSALGSGRWRLYGAVPFLALVAVGTLSLMRRGWLIVLTFVLALGMMAAVVVVAGWLTSPRFFILVVPLAFLVAVESLDLVARLLSRLVGERHRHGVHDVLAGAAVVACALALSFGLPRYYAT